MRIRRTLITTLVAASLMAGLGATPALAAPATTAAASVSLAKTTSTMNADSRGVAADVTGQMPSQAPTVPQSGPAEARGGLGSVIVAAIKRVPGLFSTVGKGVKKGYSTFRTVWQTKVPGWVRVLAGDLSAAAISDTIKGFF
jgi:hypothetical protein